jgi:hypothetical protein
MDLMLRKLKAKTGKKTSSKRKECVEAILGQIKQTTGISAFPLRGLQKVKAEWNLICLTHDTLKLWHRVLADNGRGAPLWIVAAKHHQIMPFFHSNRPISPIRTPVRQSNISCCHKPQKCVAKPDQMQHVPRLVPTLEPHYARSCR